MRDNFRMLVHCNGERREMSQMILEGNARTNSISISSGATFDLVKGLTVSLNPFERADEKARARIS